MSLLGFERALADLTGSPQLCERAIADAAGTLAAYDLDERERRRLAAMVRDPLMATNCVLYRVNRVTPLYVFFPMTCHLLRTVLRRELDVFWALTDCVDLQYGPETRRFAGYLKARLDAGTLQNEFLSEVLDYETAVMALRFAEESSDSMIRLVRFTHEPKRLLDALSKSTAIPADLETGEYWLVMDARDGLLEVRLMPSVGEALTKLAGAPCSGRGRNVTWR